MVRFGVGNPTSSPCHAVVHLGIKEPDASCQLGLGKYESIRDDSVAVRGGAPSASRIVQVLYEEWVSNRTSAYEIYSLRIQISEAISFE
jgi:hypothetical protein